MRCIGAGRLLLIRGDRGGNMYNTRSNKVLDITSQGGVAAGVQCYLHQPVMMDIWGRAGFDYVMLDMEHALVNYETMEDLVRACECNDMAPFFRVPANDPTWIRYCMDCGGKGVIIPHIMDGEDARRAVAYSHYNPGGTVHGDGALGMANINRHSNFGIDSYDEFRQWINGNFSTILLLEDESAFRNWEAILDELTPGRDGIGFGKGDLRYSMMTADGSTEAADEIIREYVPKIMAAAKERGLMVQGMVWPFPDAEGMQKLAEQGMNMIVTAADVKWLTETAKAVMDGTKK